MARWRLKAAHYLMVPGTDFIKEETNRDSGKVARTVFSVPAYLNPEDPADHNYRGEGIIVAQGKSMPRDIIFEGPPTPDMEPLDDEAQAITDQHKANWTHPIESLDGSYADQIWRSLEAQLSKSRDTQSQSLAGVSPEAFAQLQQQVTQLMQVNADLVAKLASPAVTLDAAPITPRRV